MSKFDESMSEILDIPVTVDSPVSVVENTQTTTTSTTDALSVDLMNDYKDTRDNLKEIVDKGAVAIDDILAIARESEHPRAFEVAAKLIDSVTSANEKLINLQKQMKEITGTKQSQLNVGKAAIFVGSTAELSKMLKNESKVINGDS